MLHALRARAKMAWDTHRLRSHYVLERVESAKEYAGDWDRIETRYKYLADILTHEYLNANPSMSDKERVIASDCHKRVGEFYRMCQEYRDSLGKPTMPEQRDSGPRIINN